jgi:hypothetical protein
MIPKKKNVKKRRYPKNTWAVEPGDQQVLSTPANATKPVNPFGFHHL